MLTTRFTTLVGCTTPIQQAGMGGISTPELAAAVSNAGGLGMLSGAGVPAPVLGAMLDDLTALTDAPFGVNFLMPFLDREAVELAASRARVVEFFYAEPDAELVQLVHAGGALAFWQVGSIEEAIAAERAGCDGIVVQGVAAGGHVRGTSDLVPLLAAVRGQVDVPVVAAGGIGTAQDVATALAAGADAVRLGTVFVATEECSAHPDYVQALIASSAADTVLTQAYSVMWPNAPHRVLKSCIEAAERHCGDIVGETQMGPQVMPVPKFSVPTPSVATTGNIGAMALYAGESVDAVTRIRPAAEVVRELSEGASALLAR